MIIDIHTHAWPEKVSRKARENLESAFKVKLVGDPTVTTLLKHMDKNGVSKSAVCAVASRPDQVLSINDWVFSIRGKRLAVFASMHPDYRGWRKELKRISARADGIKFQPEFQDFYVDDKKAFPIYEEAQRLKIPLLFHCGMELSGTMLVRSSPSRMAKLIRAFPKLKIIAGHFGGFLLWDEVEKHLLGKDIYMDTAFFLGQLPVSRVRAMFANHPKDRILFGTDFPLVDQKKDIDALKKLKLSKDLTERILYRNAEALLDNS